MMKENIETERTVTLPDKEDRSRPAPVEVLLVGGPMDAQRIQAPAEATHVSYWVWSKPRKGRPPEALWGTPDTMQVRYQIHPLIGNRTTWYIGRLQGTEFDPTIQALMDYYHKRSLPRMR